ncbi:MAG TPA: SAM-dependent methyltransferase [Micromonosporaceae bacterium]|nr:SAM-dependent methyltransferase [Micromonosporaceae bacterium]
MTVSSTGAGYDPSRRIDTTIPHSARVWNYWLGGKDNYAVDREAGDKFRDIFPGIVDIARGTRAFLARAVRYLAGEVGIRQFLDIGTGLPTSDNTHQVAQRVAPESRIVYVDNDPLVLAHARALLVGTPQGATDYIEADVREPDKILERAAETLDLTQPTALMLLGILGLVPDEDEIRSIVKRLMGSLPSGSYLVHEDEGPTVEGLVEATRAYAESGAKPYILRSPETTIRFFDGLELVEPGLVDVTQWRPEHSPFGAPAPVHAICSVWRKP